MPDETPTNAAREFENADSASAAAEAAQERSREIRLHAALMRHRCDAPRVVDPSVVAILRARLERPVN